MINEIFFIALILSMSFAFAATFSVVAVIFVLFSSITTLRRYDDRNRSRWWWSGR